MRLKAILTAAAFSLSCGIAVAESPASISYTTPGGRTVRATAITEHIVRVDNTPAGEAPAPVQSVLYLPAAPGAATVTDGCLHTLGGITASVYDGCLTLRTARRGSAVTDCGERRTAGGNSVLTLTTDGNGARYGAGERGHKFNFRGDTLVMYNRQNYGYTGSDPRISQMGITMPLFLSTDGYALVFDDFGAAEMTTGDVVSYITNSPTPVTYYYVAGDNLADLTENLTELTGRQPLPPFWAMGYITSKYGYRTSDETVATVDSLKSLGYPLDGIVLDLYWYGKEEDMGRWAWDPDQWPDPDGMLADLSAKGVNTVTITQPYVLRNSRARANYDELAPKGFFMADSTRLAPQEVKIWVGEGGMLDVSNPGTRQWLTNKYETLTRRGIGGWWGDLGEPETHPEEGVHANGLTARQYHNKYGNDWSSIISDLYSTRFPGTRLMTLMRGGTTGLQRYSVFPWSTDVSRSWGGLEPQIRIMLNSGLSGAGYMSSDLGGFAVGDEAYMPELYVRWVQAGLFTPVFRTHAQQFAEPFNYPQYADILRSIVRERYRWLPYNYTLAYENAAFGYPLVRPVNFTDTDGTEADNVADEYLWGSEVLVAPVTTADATSRPVYFPKGSLWIDYRNPAKSYKGGTTLSSYDAPLDVLPVFVRNGAFIPLADYPMENTGKYRADRFAVHFYAHGATEGHYTLYDDNRLTPGNIAAGQYRLIKFAGTSDGRRATVTINTEGTYEGAPGSITIDLTVHFAGGRTATTTAQVVPGKETVINLKR